jgi:hypothetical protein
MLPVKPAVKQLDVVKHTHPMGEIPSAVVKPISKMEYGWGHLYDLPQEELKRPITGSALNG